MTVTQPELRKLYDYYIQVFKGSQFRPWVRMEFGVLSMVATTRTLGKEGELL